MKKRNVLITIGLVVLTLFPASRAEAQIIEIARAVVIKAIRAIDLRVQALQNRTIGLQNAAKELENKMAKLKLKEISDWTEKQKELYKGYYEELRKIKNAISLYRQVKNIMEDQQQLLREYKRAYDLFRQDKHFTIDELGYMKQVYDSMIDAGLKCMDELLLAVNAMLTQMSDAQRLEIINNVAARMTKILADMRQFNNAGIQTSLRRAKEERDIQAVKKLYGI